MRPRYRPAFGHLRRDCRARATSGPGTEPEYEHARSDGSARGVSRRRVNLDHPTRLTHYGPWGIPSEIQIGNAVARKLTRVPEELII